MKNALIEKAIAYLGTQTHLAKACGVSQNSVSKWLTGKSNVSLEMALKIEKATKGTVKAGEFNPDFDRLLGRKRKAKA